MPDPGLAKTVARSETGRSKFATIPDLVSAKPIGRSKTERSKFATILLSLMPDPGVTKPVGRSRTERSIQSLPYKTAHWSDPETTFLG